MIGYSIGVVVVLTISVVFVVWLFSITGYSTGVVVLTISVVFARWVGTVVFGSEIGGFKSVIFEGVCSVGGTVVLFSEGYGVTVELSVGTYYVVLVVSLVYWVGISVVVLFVLVDGTV